MRIQLGCKKKIFFLKILLGRKQFFIKLRYANSALCIRNTR